MTKGRLRELFDLSPTRQLRHWGTPKPWDGLRLKNGTEIRANQVVRDADCNVIRSPLFLKPCFGQPTAFARHGGHQPIRHPRFGVVASRCMRCKAQDACESVAKQRLRTTDGIKTANLRFEKAGGGFGLRNPSDCPNAQQEFDGLIRALIAHGGFTSTNDRAAIDAIDAEEALRKQRDAERKRRERRKDIAKGRFDAEFEAFLEKERLWRQGQLEVASKRAGMPACIGRISHGSARVTADIWLLKLSKSMRSEPVNPSSIASGLIEKWPEHYQNHNALRQRVAADLKRVAKLENFIPRGSSVPIWPRFDLADAMDKIGLTTPYTP